ncbi:MAG: 50S ribosomal protein L25/general stress protein Ctc [Gammaproteobacteria bacterium]|nr:50S ribosomal protein L25/general stress protein Ctc [Gammaproteobacteria bacterium]
MSKTTLSATIRKDVGKGASRRLRREGLVPGIIYGANTEATMINLQHKELIKAMEAEEFYSQILEINVDNKKEQAVVKDIQRHAFKPKIEHIDFMRIKAGSKITMTIPLHFINEDIAIGVKKEGGVVSHAISEVEVRCLPKDLPQFIEVDVSDVKLNQIVHLSELKLPKGVEIVELSHGEGHDQPVVSIHTAKVSAEPAVEAEATEEAPASDTENNE